MLAKQEMGPDMVAEGILHTWQVQDLKADEKWEEKGDQMWRQYGDMQTKGLSKDCQPSNYSWKW